MDFNQLVDKVKAQGYKITEQRKAILEILTKNNNKLISVETILTEVKKIYSKTNITTIYRNLEILQTHNIIRKVMTDNGMALYQLTCTDAHHHHLVCKECGKTQVIDYCPMHTLTEITRDKDFTLTNHVLELYGYCKDCKHLHHEK